MFLSVLVQSVRGIGPEGWLSSALHWPSKAPKQATVYPNWLLVRQILPELKFETILTC
jgi:hypothetical protein